MTTWYVVRMDHSNIPGEETILSRHLSLQAARAARDAINRRLSGESFLPGLRVEAREGRPTLGKGRVKTPSADN